MFSLDAIPQPILDKITGSLPALAGAVIGAISTLYAARKAVRMEKQKEREREEKELQNLLDAFGVEISALWSFHMRRVGAMVEALSDGQALEFYYPLTQDYFTVYNTNAQRIGCVRDPKLREVIVVCYNKCKKVVDGFKYNNELYRDWRDMMDDTQGAPTPRGDAKFKALVEYAKVIREDHFEVKQYVEHMLGMLESRK